MPQPTRLVVIGVGRIGREHVAAIQSSDRLVLTAVVDADEHALGRVSAPGRISTTSVEQLLAEVDFDGAVVAVTSAQHVAVVTALLQAGVPVLCEKPCGLSSADVRALGALEADLGGLLRVGYWRRFVPELARLRGCIAAGQLGTLAMLSAVQWDEAPPSAAFRDPKSSGGINLDMGVHEFDMLRWLTGEEIVEIVGFASATTWAPPVDGDPETVNLVARLSGGATATISLARRHPPGDLCRIEVLGGTSPVALTYVRPGQDTTPALRLALQAQAEAFAAAIGGGSTPLAGVRDAEAAALAAERANEAVDLAAPTPVQAAQ
jgi:myo-inositol 2-dehydrogenase/D-chiro-inositol 1-dehydrogenase